MIIQITFTIIALFIYWLYNQFKNASTEDQFGNLVPPTRKPGGRLWVHIALWVAVALIGFATGFYINTLP
ncbi:MAG TPA: hypothetical protein VD794_02130 [Flavisolibacter sp.]|nr:hypothetical protein [Flavisolibacter sp.]